MLARDIQPGQVLQLKPDNPYGIDASEVFVRVVRLLYKNGYRTPWVIDTEGNAYRPSDFRRIYF